MHLIREQPTYCSIHVFCQNHNVIPPCCMSEVVQLLMVSLNASGLHSNGFTQRSTFCKAAKSFRTNRCPVDRFVDLFWKTSPGQWNTTRVNSLIWFAGHARHVAVPASGLFRYFLGRSLVSRKTLHAFITAAACPRRLIWWT